MARSYLRGHEIVFTYGVWKYLDTLEPTAGTHRVCGNCSRENREDGHDACLGGLPGLMNACCGHGDVSLAYVQFRDGHVVHGIDAMTIATILKG